MKVAFQDDREVWRSSVSKILMHRGCSVEVFDADQHIDIRAARAFDVIIMDNVLGVEPSGYERLCKLRELGFKKQLILYTATPNDLRDVGTRKDIHVVSKRSFIDRAMKKIGIQFN